MPYEEKLVAFRWNPEALLRCHGCGSQYALGALRCHCSAEAWMEVVYTRSASPTLSLSETAAWLRRHHQPLADGDDLDLGQGNTPLIPLDRLGPQLWLKDESANPTWSHKDRANATNAAVALLLESSGMIASSTGNHGASVAAYAAAAGLPAIVLCRPGMPSATVQMIWAYGGIPFGVDGERDDDVFGEFVGRGWYTATSLDRFPGGYNSPYGAEGYKRIAWEVAQQLGNVPSCIIVPTASGDTYYGVAKGFAELSEVFDCPLPTVVAVQPVTANPLERSLKYARSVVVDGARSIALSIANERTGRHAAEVAAEATGRVVSVTDEEIGRAALDMARVGHLLDPASSAALAGYRVLRSSGVIGREAVAVLLGTASGTKWLQAFDGRVRDAPVTSLSALRGELRKRELSEFPTVIEGHKERSGVRDEK